MIEQLRRTVRWRWPLILAIFLPAALVAGVSVERAPSPTSVVTVVGVAPERTENATAELVALSLGRYAVELTSVETLDSVAEGTRTDPDTLRDAVRVSISRDAGTLTIQVGMLDEREAVFVSSALAQVMVDLGEADEFMDASILAQPRAEPVGLVTGGLLVAALVLLALLIAVLIAFAAETIKPRIRTGGDAARASGAPVLASVASFIGPWPRRKPVTESETAKTSRALRAGLAATSESVEAGSIVVVGTERGAGATTIALLLARAVADRGEHTALVDLDLETAGLTTSLDLDLADGTGITDVLAGRISLTDAVRLVGGVAVIGATPNPAADQTVERHLPGLLNQASNEWTLVLIDTSPIQPGGLAEMVAAHAASAVIVCRLGSQTAHLARTAQRLAQLGLPVRGVVLNHASRVDIDQAALVPAPSFFSA